MPFINLQGRRICYQWYGEMQPERDTMIFLHDGLGTMKSWKQLPLAIGHATGMNAIAYDRYGYGRSEPRKNFPFGFMEAEIPALADLLDVHSLKRVHLIGHSDGASIALLFAGQYPGRVLSVVSVAAHTFVEPRTREGIQALVTAMDHGEVPGWLKRLHHDRTEAVLQAWSRGWLGKRHTRWNIEDWLGYVKAPTLAIQGTEDEFGTEAQVTAILNRVEGCEVWMVEGCGHTPHNEAPEAFTERVAEFLLRHTEGRSGVA